MTRRGLLLTLVLLAGGIATGAVVLAGTDDTVAAPGLDRVSNEGTPVIGLLPRDSRGLSKVHRTLGDVRSLKTGAGRTFYSLAGGCYGVGPASPTTYTLGQITCAPDFPSAERPIMDFTVFHSTVAGDRVGAESVWRSEGVAADGVAKIAFEGAGGTILAEAPVIDNTYSFEKLPQVRPTALVAYGSTGQVLFSQPLG